MRQNKEEAFVYATRDDIADMLKVTRTSTFNSIW